MPVLIHFYDKPALYRYSSILHRYVYTHIYTYLCTYIYFPEGMFTYFLWGSDVRVMSFKSATLNKGLPSSHIESVTLDVFFGWKLLPTRYLSWIFVHFIRVNSTPFRCGISKYLMIGFRQLGSQNAPPPKLLWSSCWYGSCIKSKPITWVVCPNDCPIRTFPWFKHNDIFHVKKLPKNLSLQFLFSHVSLSSRSVCPSHSGTKTGHLTTPFGIFQSKPANQVLLRVPCHSKKQVETPCLLINPTLEFTASKFVLRMKILRVFGSINRSYFFWQEIYQLCSSNMYAWFVHLLC